MIPVRLHYALPIRARSVHCTRLMRPVLMLCLIGLLSACSNLGYYAQSVRGQLALLAVSRPVPEVLADPQTTTIERTRLERLDELRVFAHQQLGLPDSASFRHYAQVGREALVWSLVAAPIDSLQARTWCYPIIGCASYRGYFSKQAALSFAEQLSTAGWDVAVESVPAYSTLGWFSDPLPSTVIHWPLPEIAGLVFHELAHEALYVPGDSAFNEAYASVVEREGVRRWLDCCGSAAQQAGRALRERRRSQVQRLIADARRRLADLYQDPPDRMGLLRRKQGILDELQDSYATLRAAWDGYSGYDYWFGRPLNNAHFASVDTYDAWQPALRSLLRLVDGDMQGFHQACRALSRLPDTVRHSYLRRLLEPHNSRRTQR